MLTYSCMVKIIKVLLSMTLAGILFAYPRPVASHLPDNSIALTIIQRLNPSLRTVDALSISSAIASTSCPITPVKLLALLYLESSLRLRAVNSKTADYGLAQINSHTIKRFKLDKERLMNSYSYSVESACKVLWHHRKIVGRYPEWIGSYRAGTNFKSPSTRQNARRYVNLINSTVAKINE